MCHLRRSAEILTTNLWFMSHAPAFILHKLLSRKVIFMWFRHVIVFKLCKLCTEKLRIETMVPRIPFQGYWNRSWRRTSATVVFNAWSVG